MKDKIFINPEMVKIIFPGKGVVQGSGFIFLTNRNKRRYRSTVTVNGTQQSITGKLYSFK